MKDPGASGGGAIEDAIQDEDDHMRRSGRKIHPPRVLSDYISGEDSDDLGNFADAILSVADVPRSLNQAISNRNSKALVDNKVWGS